MIYLALRRSGYPLSEILLLTDLGGDDSEILADETTRREELPEEIYRPLLVAAAKKTDGVDPEFTAEICLCSGLRHAVSLFAGLGAARRMCSQNINGEDATRFILARRFHEEFTGVPVELIERLFCHAESVGHRWGDVLCPAMREGFGANHPPAVPPPF